MYHDSLDQLAATCEVSYACLGKSGEFILIDLSAPSDAHLVSLAKEKGWDFLGVFGLQGGVPRVEYVPGYDNLHTMLGAGLAFCIVVSDRLRNPPEDDGVQWLESLYALEDTRGA